MFVSSFQFNSIFWKAALFVLTYHQIAHQYSKIYFQILLFKKKTQQKQSLLAYLMIFMSFLLLLLSLKF